MLFADLSPQQFPRRCKPGVSDLAPGPHGLDPCALHQLQQLQLLPDEVKSCRPIFLAFDFLQRVVLGTCQKLNLSPRDTLIKGPDEQVWTIDSLAVDLQGTRREWSSSRRGRRVEVVIDLGCSCRLGGLARVCFRGLQSLASISPPCSHTSTIDLL